MILRWDGNVLFTCPQRYQNVDRGAIPLPGVTQSAIDLIQGLIAHKETRLGGKIYRERGSAQSKNVASLSASRSHRASLALQSFSRSSKTGASSTDNFVFQNDSVEIKRHPFFRGVVWDRLHTMTPPFVPRIHASQSITKYFEDERSIMGGNEDHVTATSTCLFTTSTHVQDLIDETTPQDIAETLERMDCKTRGPNLKREDRERAMKWLNGKDAGTVSKALGMGGRGKRPRDKVLRDPVLGRVAVRVRKEKAFPGYTFRRLSNRHVDCE
jgi:protein-serine/threonine kinase